MRPLNFGHADLHLHTHFSDGTFTPEEVVVEGQRHGFAALAITDHDTVEGCERMAAACAGAGLAFLTGVELTAEMDDHELHILGYGFDAANPKLLDQVTLFQNVRQERIREMVVRLNDLNVPIEAEAVFALANCRAPGRPHVARALVAAGLCGSLDEAFERFLKKHRPAWVPKYKVSAPEAIALIHQAGGAAILAHPGLNRVDDLVPGLVEAGLDGIECFHTKHSTAITGHYLRMADKLGVLVTGGSDCHGLNKGRPLIGTIKLPCLHLEQLQDRIAAIRRAAQSPDPGPPSTVSLHS